MSKLMIPHNKGNRSVSSENIVRIEASSNYSKIYFNHTKPLLVAKVLHWFEDKLPGEIFIRVHRSHLVNKLFMEVSTDKKSNNIILTTGEKVVISRRKKNNVLMQLR